jgi:uncharacterized protein (TIGR04141 family)
MKKSRPNNRRLSVYLMKEEYHDFSSVLKGGTAECQVKRGKTPVGTLYVKPIAGHRPAWLSFFAGSVPEGLPENLNNSYVSAVFLIKRNKRIFAITFGYGRNLLQPGTWEERFGLKVVLNSIDPDKIRVIDRKNLDTMLTHTRTQTSRKCDLANFNLDVQQILLKAVTGEPREETFASSVSGADALSITCRATMDNIEGKCDELFQAFQAEAYEKSFPWVKNIFEVNNKQKIDELNDDLVRRIRGGGADRLFLAVPEIVDWSEIDGFKFKEKQDEIYSDLFIPDFLGNMRDPQNITDQTLKQRRVFLVRSDTGVPEPRWSVFYCLNCEIDSDGKTYILTEGKWYEIEASFVAQVNQRIKAVRKSSIPLVAGKDEKEPDYCRRLFETDESHYAHMDRHTIWHGGGYSQIEFCDLYTKDRKLIHLKRYGGASVLSHLFTQGTNSARLFLADTEFREKVSSKLPKSHKFDANEQPSPRDYEIVFAIISETADTLPQQLPFLSKITLMRTMQELQVLMGFNMSIAGIKIGR